MCIKGALRNRGFTLVEVLVATALAGIVVTVIAMLSVFTSRSYVAATNYADMALKSRMALDNISRSIRQSRQVSAYSTNSITLLDSSGNSVQYTFNPSTKSVLCTIGGVTTTYLTGCNSLQFWLYQRTPKSNTFTCYTPAYVTNAKLVQVTWSCSRQILGVDVNNEVVESASICLRNH
ncbi:MAG TPA: prepilin-type N-terminal cleavage/methylation domain-containing protein [Patescibacteria group bacterium]|nr:prepilin-type N-terminal cleavage/methylation domain-containing protein [Patescibacteria group bacterium]